jgi:butyrate kinase
VKRFYLLAVLFNVRTVRKIKFREVNKMKKLVLVSLLGLAFTVMSGIQSRAGDVHVAEDWTGAYVPAQLQNNNVHTGSFVASTWAGAYVPQKLRNECRSKGGYVATSWADAYVVQQPRNTGESASDSKCS